MGKSAIGIFDSGFGGLTILKEIVKAHPSYDYIYLGDNARAPYGSRSSKIVYKFTEQSVDFLFKKNCELIILACNTASSDALFTIQREYLPVKYPDKRVLGIIVPTVEIAVERSSGLRFGIMATEGTVQSKSFVVEFLKKNKKSVVFQSACPLLVPIVEYGEHNSPLADIAIKKYIKPLLKRKIDTLILGCTHYPFLEKKIIKYLPEGIKIVHQGRAVAEKLTKYFKDHPEIKSRISQGSSLKFYTTDLTKRFEILGSKFFGKRIYPEKVDLDS